MVDGNERLLHKEAKQRRGRYRQKDGGGGGKETSKQRGKRGATSKKEERRREKIEDRIQGCNRDIHEFPSGPHK